MTSWSVQAPQITPCPTGDPRSDEPGEPQVALNLRTLNGHLDIDEPGAVSMLIWDGDSTVMLRPGPLDGSSAAWTGAHILTTVAGMLRWELLRPPPGSPNATSPNATAGHLLTALDDLPDVPDRDLYQRFLGWSR